MGYWLVFWKKLAPNNYRFTYEETYHQDISLPAISLSLPNGFYGQFEFRTLAEKIGLKAIRVERLLTHMLTLKEKVIKIIQQAYLSKETKNYTRICTWKKLAVWE